MKAHNLLCGGLAAASLFASMNARAQLLAYDSFSYTSGGSLVGQNGGTGFGGAYTASNSGTSVASPGLTYTDSNGSTLSTTGNGAYLPGGNNGVYRALGSALGGGNSTIYVSFLEQVNSSATYAGLSLFTGTGTENVFFGAPGNTANNPAINLESSGPISGTGETTLTTATAQFLVIELQFGTASATGGVTASLFDNPALGSTQPATANDVLSNGTAFTFDTIRIQSGADTGELDEVRIGDTYADVAPIPEPTTMALSLLGGAGLVGVVARRRLV